MEGKTLTAQLAAYAVEDHFSALSEQDILMTKLSCVDWVAAAWTGVTEEGVRLLMDLAEEEHVAGNCVLIGQGKTSSPANSALINGTQSHAIDFDDIHDYLSLHLCSPVMPAVLAAAEYKGVGGRELINGIVNGMQIMVALSAGIMPEHYNIGHWHATGTIGIFGAAAGAGVVL